MPKVWYNNNVKNKRYKEIGTMTTNYAYTVTAYYDDAQVTTQTSDVEVAIATLMHHTEQGVRVEVTDNYTGECYVIANIEEPHITTEWALMINGWLMAQMWS
jgi:hypothetical protein